MARGVTVQFYNLQGPTENRQGEWAPWLNIVIIIIIIIINVSRSDACWESKMAEGTCRERMILVKRRLIFLLPTVWGFYNCTIKEHTVTESR